MAYPIRRSQKASVALALLLTIQISLVRSTSIAASFRRDVILSSNNNIPQQINPLEAFEEDINNELLVKAIPLQEYEAMNNKFLDTGISHNSRMLQEENDDFYAEYDGMYSFSGYSMKYVKCQPVQYFSEDAISAGEHSPMITQDIIILRLCPYKSCTASLQYGCYYNYADYAISSKDYLAIMLKYRAKRRDFVCTYCAACGVVYKGDAAAADEEGEGRRRLDEAQAGDDAAVAEEEVAAEEENVQEENVDEQANAGGYDCSVVDSYCYDYDNECGNGEDDPDGYMDYDGYLNYLSCTEVRYNDHSYFVRPRCDGSKGSIKMDVFYDMYCVQYAGNDVSIKSLGVGFREGIFTEFYNSTCIDCSKSDAAPFYNTNSALCNKLHTTSAKCTSDLLYNLFDGEENDSTECSYIESMRFGTYDETGKLSSATNGVTWTSAEVSTSQNIMLSISIALCLALIVYSCYLHHAMTNLLIKSLSHRELLPPSRHNRHSSRRSQKQLLSHKDGVNNSDGSDDWEKPGLV